MGLPNSRKGSPIRGKKKRVNMFYKAVAPTGHAEWNLTLISNSH